MEAQELRVGNYVYTQSGKLVVNRDSIYKVENINIQSARKYKPIPLTEEWLLKFGFGQMRNKFYKKHVTLTKSEGFYVAFVQDELKSVHQLQNLYFALTGEELQLK